MDVLTWIEQVLAPRTCTTDELWYDHMDSQSDRGLPILYQPFDVTQARHWADRGWLYDFLYATGTGRVLDLGPGDGWPSLNLAPHVQEVVGVEASQRRVEVCRENARRLGITNARFLHVAPGAPLPFPDRSFDGIAAATSIEQTPDPYATLRELYRVLRPGGKLRISYEALSRYRGKPARGAWLMDTAAGLCRLVLNERQIDQERVIHYALDLDLSRQEVTALLGQGGEELEYEDLSVAALEQARAHIVAALTCTLTHPSGRTLAAWLKEIGFKDVTPSYSGAWFAWRLFAQLVEECHPQDLASLDAFLRPCVEAFVEFPAPLESDTPITATR
jgi:ubiquinone/menaquinone biosynthesis C-methylase UbiE